MLLSPKRLVFSGTPRAKPGPTLIQRCAISKEENIEYEDNALGKIPDDQYRLLSDSYTAELHELKAKIPELQNQINEIKTEESNVDRFIAPANKYIYIKN